MPCSGAMNWNGVIEANLTEISWPGASGVPLTAQSVFPASAGEAATANTPTRTAKKKTNANRRIRRTPRRRSAPSVPPGAEPKSPVDKMFTSPSIGA